MKHYLLAVLLLPLLILSCDDDEAPVSPVNQLSRYDGWQIVNVETDFAARVDAAVAALPDSTVEQSGLTRSEIRANYNDRIAAVGGVEDCERDDVLFFDAGVAAVVSNGEACPSGSQPHVLAPFHLKSYSTDLGVTRLTLTSQDQTESSEYSVTTISDVALTVGQSRTVDNNLILPAFTYTVTYNFRGR